MPKSNPPHAPRLPALLPLLPLLLAAGCATTSPPVCEPARIPPPPALSTPLPSADYSDAARQTIEAWRQQLKAMPAM